MRVALIALLIAVPVAAQAPDLGIWNPPGPEPVSLYVHCVPEIWTACAVNTQVPEARYWGGGLGLVDATLTCLPLPDVGFLAATRHTLYSFSSPGYVEYDVDGGGPRLHWERGLADDVLIDNTSLESRFYVRVPGPVPVAPQVVVAARLQEGDDTEADAATLDNTPIIAAGRSEPVTLHPLVEHPQVRYVGPDTYFGGDLYEYRFPLQLERNIIPADESFHIRTTVFTEVPTCDEERYISHGAQASSFGGQAGRLDLAIDAPLQIEMLHPQVVGDDVLVHVSASSPWGNYDVDEKTLELVAAAESGVEPDFRLMNMAQPYDKDGRHLEPLMATWAWEGGRTLGGEGLIVTATVRSDQGAEAVARAGLSLTTRVEPCGSSDPGCPEMDTYPSLQEDAPSVPAALLAIALLALARRNNR